MQYSSANYQKLILKVDKIRAIKEEGVNLCNDEYIKLIEKKWRPILYRRLSNPSINGWRKNKSQYPI